MRPAVMAASHSPIERAPASCRRGVVPAKLAVLVDRPGEAQAQQQRIRDRAGDQGELDPEQRHRGIFGRAYREQQGAGRHREQEARDRDRQQDAAHRGERHFWPEPEQPQVERHDRAEQQRKPHDVAGIDERIDPERLPQRRREARVLQRARKLRQHGLSMRSAGRWARDGVSRAPGTARRGCRRWSRVPPSCGSRSGRRSGRRTP